jgi:hypothetical protein
MSAGLTAKGGGWPKRGHGRGAFMHVRLLQANLNRSRRAQDLMFQNLTERRVCLAMATEPFRVPKESSGVEDLSSSVAVFWNPTTRSPACSLIERG